MSIAWQMASLLQSLSKLHQVVCWHILPHRRCKAPLQDAHADADHTVMDCIPIAM